MTHEENVQQFLREKKEFDPKKYEEVCEKYPTLTSDKWRSIRRREVTVGLNVEGYLYDNDESRKDD